MIHSSPHAHAFARRWMGPIRFHIGGVWELIKGRYYRCRVHALPPEAADKLLANAAQGADQLQGPAAPVAAVAGGGQANPLASHQGAGDVKSSNGGASAGGSGRQLLEGCPEPGVAHSISSRLPDYPPGVDPWVFQILSGCVVVPQAVRGCVRLEKQWPSGVVAGSEIPVPSAMPAKTT